MKKNHTPTRAELMFSNITENTNFHELVERPEWPEIKKKILLVLNNFKQLLEILKKEHDEYSKEGWVAGCRICETICKAEEGDL